MVRKNDKNGGDKASKGDDREMFDSLFREELDVQKKDAQGDNDAAYVDAPKPVNPHIHNHVPELFDLFHAIPPTRINCYDDIVRSYNKKSNHEFSRGSPRIHG